MRDERLHCTMDKAQRLTKVINAVFVITSGRICYPTEDAPFLWIPFKENKNNGRKSSGEVRCCYIEGSLNLHILF